MMKNLGKNKNGQFLSGFSFRYTNEVVNNELTQREIKIERGLSS